MSSTPTTEQALLRMVLERPNEDEPRLVFADWLLERGDPRGNLIQMQIAYARMSPEDRDRAGLALRIRKLIAERGADMAGEVARRAAAYEFTGGLVSKVTMTAGAFTKHGEALFAGHPIETLRLRPLGPDALRELAIAPPLARVRRLTLEQFAERGRFLPLATLARSPWLSCLEELVLAHVVLAPEDVQEAFASIIAPALRSLVVMGSPISPRAVIGLADNPTPPKLRRITIDARGGADPEELRAAFEALGSSEAFRELCEVELDAWRQPSWPLDAWLLGPNASRLEHLCIGGCTNGDEVAAALGRSPNASLRSLDLGTSTMTSTGLRALLSWSGIQSLAHMRVPPALISSLPPRLRAPRA